MECRHVGGGETVSPLFEVKPLLLAAEPPSDCAIDANG